VLFNSIITQFLLGRCCDHFQPIRNFGWKWFRKLESTEVLCIWCSIQRCNCSATPDCDFVITYNR